MATLEERMSGVVDIIRAEAKGDGEGLSAPIMPQNNGRDANGRFVKGNPGGPGRPTKAQELATLAAVVGSATPEQVKAAITSLMNHPTSWRAQQAGLELHLAYTLGKPVQRIQQSEGGLGDILDELGE